MKIFKRVLIIICIILSFCVNKSLAVSGTVKASAIRVREKPNTTSGIITNVYENDIVEILETDGEWCKIKLDDKSGYVKKEFLSISSEKKKESNKNTSTNNSTNSNNTVNTNNKSNTTTNENIANTNTVTNNNENSNEETKYATNNASLRLLPSITSSIILQLDNGKQVTKILEMNNWVKITDGSVQGWVNKSKITETSYTPNEVSKKETPKQPETPKEQSEEKPTETNKNGKVKVETAKIRKTPSTSADIVGTLDYYDDVTIIAEEGDWYKISGKGMSGYVSKKLITVSNNISSRSLIENREENIDNTVITKQANNAINESLSTTSSGSQVVDYAKQFLGTSYVSGGKNPQTGFDCSGFTKYIYSNFGYSLVSTAASQNNLGEEIGRENIEPGDLILFYDEGKSKIGHTGIYIGDGNFVHAANASRGVVTDNLNTNSYYNSRFITAKRIVE